jgi:tetratricopeptide (TPR) repeat protein
MKMNDFNKAKSDATEALNIDENYLKAYIRRGESNMRLCCWQEAVDDFHEALKQETNNVNIYKMLEESRRELMRMKELEVNKANNNNKF